MNRKLTTEEKELKQAGTCVECKINPRLVTDKYAKLLCKECDNRRTLNNYNNLKSGLVGRYGGTIESEQLRKYKSGASRRGIAFNLTDAQAIAIMHQPCEYCKLPNAMGIDRVNSKLNYAIDTVVPCCGNCNRAKHIQSAEQYNNWLQGLVDRLIAERLNLGQLTISNLG